MFAPIPGTQVIVPFETAASVEIVNDRYFGKVPAELTPKETAFLVCLIPNPVRYHQAHAQGRTGPGMEQLVRNLLAKLRATGALSDEEYEAALLEELHFAPETPPAG